MFLARVIKNVISSPRYNISSQKVICFLKFLRVIEEIIRIEYSLNIRTEKFFLAKMGRNKTERRSESKPDAMNDLIRYNYQPI